MFEKKTVKGFPKKIAPNIYDFVSTNGFPVYGQNIKRQYDCLVELPDKYLYEVATPILAYTSSVGEIGMIEESFYRSGDNGAFQALMPLFNANTYNVRYILTMLRKIFANFGYGTSMQNIKELEFKLPVLPDGTPDFEYMEKYIRAIEKLTIKGVVEWKDKELSLLKIITTA